LEVEYYLSCFFAEVASLKFISGIDNYNRHEKALRALGFLICCPKAKWIISCSKPVTD